MVAHKFSKAMLMGFLLLLTACQGRPSPTPTLKDDSLITKIPCAPPCWHGLTPGESTFEDVSDFIQLNPLINGNASKPKYVSTGGSYQAWRWAGESPDSPQVNFFDYTPEGVLERIVLKPNTDITAKDIIKVYGPPTLITISEVLIAESPIKTSSGIEIDAVYIDPPMLLTWAEKTEPASVPAPSKICLSLDVPIHTIEYDMLERAEAMVDQWRQNMILHPKEIFEGVAVFQMQNNEVQITCVMYGMPSN